MMGYILNILSYEYKKPIEVTLGLPNSAGTCFPATENVGTRDGGFRPVGGFEEDDGASFDARDWKPLGVSFLSRMSLFMVCSVINPNALPNRGPIHHYNNNCRHHRFDIIARVTIRELQRPDVVISFRREQAVWSKGFVLSCCCRCCFPWGGRWLCRFIVDVCVFFSLVSDFKFAWDYHIISRVCSIIEDIPKNEEHFAYFLPFLVVQRKTIEKRHKWQEEYKWQDKYKRSIITKFTRYSTGPISEDMGWLSPKIWGDCLRRYGWLLRANIESIRSHCLATALYSLRSAIPFL